MIVSITELEKTRLLIWQDVPHELDGYAVSVIFDDRAGPFQYKRYDGVVKKQGTQSVPYLINPSNDHVMAPPWNAKVIVHTPTERKDTW